MAKTGKYYECLSKKGEETKQVQDYFTIGQVYAECDLDFLGDNECNDTSFLLYSDPIGEDAFCVAMYVSAMDFEEVGEPVIIILN